MPSCYLSTGVPSVVYRRKCYQIFTVKSKLDRIVNKMSKEQTALKEELYNSEEEIGNNQTFSRLK